MSTVQNLVCGICGEFEAKNLAGLKAHQRACLAKDVPEEIPEDLSVWLLDDALEFAEDHLSDELIIKGEALNVRAEMFRSYRKQYYAMKESLPTKEDMVEHLKTANGRYRYLYSVLQSLNQNVIGKDKTDNKLWGKGHNDSTYMKEYDAYRSEVEGEMKAIEDEAWTQITFKVKKIFHRMFPDSEVRELLLESEKLFNTPKEA